MFHFPLLLAVVLPEFPQEEFGFLDADLSSRALGECGLSGRRAFEELLLGLFYNPLALAGSGMLVCRGVSSG